MLNEEELDATAEKLHEIKDQVATIFEDANLNIGEVLSLLSGMLVSIAMEDANVSPLKLIEAIARGCQAHIDIMSETETNEPNEGVVQWLN